jgi:signal transduction histidine kinase
MDWQSAPYVLSLLTAAVLSALVAYSAWRRRHAPGAIALTVLMLAAAGWSLGNALEFMSDDLPTKLGWVRAQYVGIVIIPLAWLAFALHYTGRERWLTHRAAIGLAVVPLVTLGLVWTNDAHGLIWEAMRLETSQGLATLDPTYGPWFWVHVGYSYLLLVWGTLLLLQALVRSPQLYRGQAGTLLSAAFLPWLANVLYLGGLNPFPHLDLTPFAFTGSGLILAWGLFRFQLLDVVPVARDVVIDSMDDGVIVLDGHNRIVDLNPAAEGIIGLPRGELVGEMSTRVMPDWFTSIELDEAPAEIILGDGSAQRVYEPSISPLRDRKGERAGQLVILHDVTERKRAEDERLHLLHEQAARVAAEATTRTLQRLQLVTDAALAHLALDALLDSLLLHICEFLSADITVVLLMEGQALVTRAAKGVEEEVERGVRVPVGKGFAGRVAAERRPISAENIDEVEIISPFLREKGVRSLLGVPLIVEGRVIGVLLVGSFVTRTFSEDDEHLLQLVADRVALSIEHARLYEAERKERFRAEEAIRARDLFMSVASHELRTPITTLRAYSDLLQRYCQREGIASPKLERGLQVIGEQATRLDKLISYLMDLSRIQSGRLSLEPTPVDLGALTRRLMESFEPILDQHTLELQAPDAPLIVEGDEMRLEQVLQNLINNAIKYSPDGGRITVMLQEAAGQARLAVSDEGVGIPASALPHLFDPFYRAENTHDHRIEGFGLGLSVVQEIVARHGGTIEVQSVEGKGSTFTVSLPIGQE